MLRSALASITLLAATAAPVYAQATPGDREAAVRAKLRSTMVTLDFTDTPVQTFASHLGNLTGCNFVISRDAAQLVADTETRVTLQLQQVPAETALKLACDMLDLHWRVDRGVVVIATEDERWGTPELRTYDLRDLLIRPQDHEAPFRDLFGALTKKAPAEKWETEYGLYVEEIAELIRGSIAPEFWDTPGGSLTQIGGTCMIKAPASVHDAIAGMLTDLRALRNLRVAVELTVIDASPAVARALRATMQDAPALPAAGDEALAAAIAAGHATVLSRSSISGYNTQQVAVRDGTQTRIDLPTGSPTPQAVLHDGLTAQIRPVLVAGGTQVHLRARLQFAGDHTRTQRGHALDAVTVDTALVAPLHATLLLGGGSRGEAPAGEQPARETLLLARVTTPSEAAVPLRYGHSDADDAASQKLQAKLAKVAFTCDFTEAPLLEVAAFLQQATKVNFIVKPSVFDEFPEDELLVNLQLTDVSAWESVQLLANLLRLRLEVRDDYVAFTTRYDRTAAAVAIYDVRDLVQPPIITAPHNPDLTAAPGDRGPGNNLDDMPEPFTADNIADLIRETIDPESWDTPPNSLEPTAEFLIIRNAPAILRQVDDLLQRMRAVAHQTVLAEALFLDVSEAEWKARGLGRVLTPAQVEALFTDAAAGTKVRTVAAGRVTGPNDQRFSVHAGRQLASFDGETGPLYAADGVVVDIHPVLAADRTLVHCAVDVRRRSAPVAGELQPGLPVQELRSHLKIPSGGAVALGRFAVAGRPGSLLILRVTPAKK